MAGNEVIGSKRKYSHESHVRRLNVPTIVKTPNNSVQKAGPGRDHTSELRAKQRSRERSGNVQ